jgi:hypothetical protein
MYILMVRNDVTLQEKSGETAIMRVLKNITLLGERGTWPY